MSIVCAARKNGQIAISADTMTSYGGLRASASYRENPSKLLRVNGSVIGIVGWCAISSALEHLIDGEEKLFRFGNRMEVMTTLLELHRRMKQDYFLESYEDRNQPVESTQLHALIATTGGLYEVCSYRSVGECNSFWAVGSGRRIALGAMFANWDSAENARDIAEIGVRAAAEFDDACGLPLSSEVIQLAV